MTFIQSSGRVLFLYVSLLEYLEAPDGHWIHTEHPHDWGKTASNPVSAHVLERSWTLLFDCMRLDGPAECPVCDPGQKDDCRIDTCECLDPVN